MSDLKKLYDSGWKTTAIAKKLGWTPSKTASAIERGLKDGTITKRNGPQKWTPEQDAILREHYGKTPSPDLAAMIGVNVMAVRARARRIGAVAVRRLWNSDDTQWLKDNYATKSVAQMCNDSGWGHATISKMIKELGPSNTVVKTSAMVSTKGQRRKPSYTPAIESHIIPGTARPWRTRVFGECAYPYGGRYHVMSCCAPTWEGTSYCEAHAALCGGYRRVA